ncbi:hypothetical protein CALVIDRAFT_569325 [Calocera viscosa TUFC12733]|uniref:Uncharacterized protein n=1 Tax=Calocera viscosa (strain TUFC12733) TaxID=1330018 RepID=A0A167G2W9_CALVF|nr:hypothetical protein CALVIDRAFT_569325 [Calocera viscosa TUFC12733]
MRNFAFPLSCCHNAQIEDDSLPATPRQAALALAAHAPSSSSSPRLSPILRANEEATSTMSAYTELNSPTPSPSSPPSPPELSPTISFHPPPPALAVEPIVAGPSAAVIKPYYERELRLQLATCRPNVDPPLDEPLDRYTFDTWRQYRTSQRWDSDLAGYLNGAYVPGNDMYCSKHKAYFKAPQTPDIKAVVTNQGSWMTMYHMPQPIWPDSPPLSADTFSPTLLSDPDIPEVNLTVPDAADDMTKREFLSQLNGPPPSFGPHPFPGPTQVIPFRYDAPTRDHPHLIQNPASFFYSVKDALAGMPSGPTLAARCLGYSICWRIVKDKDRGPKGCTGWWILFGFKSPHHHSVPYVFIGTSMDWAKKQPEKHAETLLAADTFLGSRPNGDENGDPPGFVKGTAVYTLLIA